MNVRNDDVLVIGGGIAACVAADEVMNAGKHVTMVFPNGGSTEISAGMLDIMGVIPGDTPVVCEDYAEGIEKLIKKYPSHVYGKCKQELEHGVESLVTLAGKGGYILKGFSGKNKWFPNNMGTFTIAAFVPEMMYDGEVIADKKEKVLVVGFKGNVSFNSSAVAMSYGKYQKKLNGKAEYYATEIQIEGWGERRKVSDGELADYFDTKEGIDELTAKVKTFCENNKYYFDKILFPPVLGYLNYSANIKLLKTECHCKVAEVAVWGNSVVGFRFTRALYRGLELKGATIIKGAVVKKINTSVNGVQADCVIGLTDQYHTGRKEIIEAPVAVLATGGFIGGGIKARHTDVWIELLEEHIGKVTIDQLNRNAVNPSGQDFMRIGTKVDENMAVLNPKFDKKVYACGDILAGHNFANERSGSGIAIATACLAGKNAASNA